MRMLSVLWDVQGMTQLSSPVPWLMLVLITSDIVWLNTSAFIFFENIHEQRRAKSDSLHGFLQQTVATSCSGMVPELVSSEFSALDLVELRLCTEQASETALSKSYPLHTLTVSSFLLLWAPDIIVSVMTYKRNETNHTWEHDDLMMNIFQDYFYNIGVESRHSVHQRRDLWKGCED